MRKQKIISYKQQENATYLACYSCDLDSETMTGQGMSRSMSLRQIEKQASNFFSAFNDSKILNLRRKQLSKIARMFAKKTRVKLNTL